MVRFLHAADLHLGRGLSAGGPADAAADPIADTLHSAPYDAVERLVDVALDADVDFVVLAGDLYDDDARSVRANSFLVEQFERLAAADVPVYVVYGNHDPVGSATRYFEFPPNVHEFGHEAAAGVTHPDADGPAVAVWGQSYRDRHESRKLHRGFTPEGGRPAVGVLHTGLDPDGGRYVPVSPADLRSKEEIDYWALGHVHQRRTDTDGTPLVYPGTPQGRDVGEPGPGGAYLVDLDGRGETELEYVVTSPVVFETVTVDVGDPDIETVTDVEDAVADVAAGLPGGLEVPARRPGAVEAVVCRWRLAGNGPAHEVLTADPETTAALTDRLRERLATRSPAVWTESVRIETGPPRPDPETLREDDPVIDEVLALFEETDRTALRERFADPDAIGRLWTDVDDHEDAAPDELSLTGDRVDELVERARRRVLAELAGRRAE